MALLLLRHALTITSDDGEDEDDPSNILSVSLVFFSYLHVSSTNTKTKNNQPSVLFQLVLLRAAGFLLPCYIMAWAISILQHRRQRQVSIRTTHKVLSRQPVFYFFVGSIKLNHMYWVTTRTLLNRKLQLWLHSLHWCFSQVNLEQFTSRWHQNHHHPPWLLQLRLHNNLKSPSDSSDS